jgi:glycosyltransferase involved in cell wall biosynthesis
LGFYSASSIHPFLCTVRVLLIHQYFNTPVTGGALRSYYLAKALINAGVQVSIITTHNHAKPKNETVEGLDVHYLPVVYNNRFGFFRRVGSFLKFVWSIVKEAGRFREVDVVYAISTPLTTGLAAMWIRWRYKIPFIFEVGDLWPEAPIQLGVIRNPILKSSLRFLEKKIYQAASQVVALSNPIDEAIRKIAPDKETVIVPNMADTDYHKPTSVKPEYLLQQYGVKDQFVVSYIGTLGFANGLEYLIQCAAECSNEALSIRFIICGDGAESQNLQELAASFQLQNIIFIPFQNREGVNEILQITDAVFISFKPLPVLETGSPNKYFDGLASGKLIVCNFGGWLKEEIELTGCGFSASHPREFVEQIKRYMRDASLRRQAQQAARDLALKSYSRARLGEKFVEIFKTAGQSGFR